MLQLRYLIDIIQIIYLVNFEAYIEADIKERNSDKYL